MGAMRTLLNHQHHAPNNPYERGSGRGWPTLTLTRPRELGGEVRFERHPTKGWRPRTVWRNLKQALRARGLR